MIEKDMLHVEDDMKPGSVNVICQTFGCGNTLQLQELIYLDYPDDLVAVRDLLRNGAHQLFCPVCKGLTSVTGNAIVCTYGKIHHVAAYISPEFTARFPDVQNEILSTYEESYTVQFYTTHDDFQFRVTSLAFKSAFPFFEEFFNLTYSGGNDEIAQWLTANKTNIDKEFLAISYLIQEKVTPFLVLITDSEDAFQDREAFRELARAAQMVIGLVVPEAHSDVQKAEVEKEVRAKIDQRIERAIQIYTILLALQMEKSKEVRQVDETVRRFFPKGLLTSERIKGLSELSERYEGNEAFKPFFRYCLQAILAALCQYADMENPDRSKWAEYYMSFEWARYTSEDDAFFIDNGVSPEFATQTLTPDLIWNYYSRRVNTAADRNNEDEITAANDVGGKIISSLGWNAQFEEFLLQGMDITLDMEPEGEADVYFKMLTDGEMGKVVVRTFLRNSINRGIEHFVRVIELLREKFIADSANPMAVWVSCRASEELNDRSLYHLSRSELEVCENRFRELGAWPPVDKEIHVDFLTEYANSLRYLGQPSAALQHYEQCRLLLDEDYTDSRFRINERNRAIVLREMMRVGESISILSTVLPYSETYSETAQILTSVSVAHQVLGQKAMAVEYLKAALKAVPAGRTLEAERLLPLVSLASLTIGSEPQLAYDAAVEAMEIAKHQNNRWARAVAGGLAARSAKFLQFSSEKRIEINKNAIELLEQVLADTTSANGRSIRDLPIRGLLAETLETAGEMERAEDVLYRALQDFLSDGGGSWRIHANLARFSLKRQDRRRAIQHLSEARKNLVQIAGSMQSNRDPVEFMSDATILQNNLADLFLIEYPGETTDDDLRSAADFQASVVFSSQLLQKAKLDDPNLNDELFYQGSYLAHSLLKDDVAVAQVISTTQNYFMLISTLEAGHTVLKIARLELQPGAKQQLLDQVAYRLSVARPQSRQDPLTQIGDWVPFIQSVDRAFHEHVSPQSHICIVPGQLSGLPLHYISGNDYSFSYAPSLATICLLRHRRERRLGAGRWRPRSLHDFVVWRTGERPEIISDFQNASDSLRESIQSHAVEYTSSIGVDGTEANLVAALEEKDCVKISAHGRAKLDSLRFELLLSANGQLPPQDSRALDSELGENFLLNWDELEGISRASPIVFSTACASGMAVSVEGGERLGLERYLFNTGTYSYIAPQWPIPVAHIQSLMNSIIGSYFEHPDLTIYEIIYNSLRKQSTDKIPEWVIRSIILIGDWL